MGMFDYVNYTANCWRCGEVLKDWQSKDGERHMELIEPSEVTSFYTNCRVCGAWNEFIRDMLPTFSRNEVAQQRETGEDKRFPKKSSHNTTEGK